MAARGRTKDAQETQPAPRPPSTTPTLSADSTTTGSKTPNENALTTRPIPSGNIVGYLSLFFAQGSFVDKDMTPYISKEDEVRVLTVMLRDIVFRKCTLEDLVLHLFTYCTRVDTTSLDTHQLFLKAVWKMLPQMESRLITPVCHRVLAKLAYAIPFAVEDLLIEMCDERTVPAVSEPGGCLFRILEESLKYAQEKERTDLKDSEPRFIDDSFRMGDCPLVFVSLRRRSDLILLLLRYGAKVKANWLSFEGILEVLLFSPNTVIVPERAKIAIEECVPLICAALPDNSCYRQLKKKKEEGYCELYQGWEDILLENVQPKGVSSLQHLSRCTIRSHLNDLHSLPASVNKLPLPSLMKKYLDLYLI